MLDSAIWTRVAGCCHGCAISRVVLKSAQRLEVKKSFQCMQFKIFPSWKELGDEDECLPRKHCRESLAMFSSNRCADSKSCEQKSKQYIFWLLLLVPLWSPNFAVHWTLVQAIAADCWAEPAGLAGCFRTRWPVLPFRVTRTAGPLLFLSLQKLLCWRRLPASSLGCWSRGHAMAVRRQDTQEPIIEKSKARWKAMKRGWENRQNHQDLSMFDHIWLLWILLNFSFALSISFTLPEFVSARPRTAAEAASGVVLGRCGGLLRRLLWRKPGQAGLQSSPVLWMKQH